MEILVGNTGFVGGNIAAKHNFDKVYNSKNITSAFGTCPNLLVYSGVPAEMFLANSDPAADRSVTKNAAKNIFKIKPKRLVLISTIAVLDNPVGADEDTVIDETKLTAYGLNRLMLERDVMNITKHCHIIRLPALFGKGIKKNFIYDIINFLPPMLKQEKFIELCAKEPIISEHYVPNDNGFYKLNVSDDKRAKLKAAFERTGFSALNFTDSRSIFQFYNLKYLWSHIETVIKHEIPLLHTSTQPLSAAEVYKYLYNKEFSNELSKLPFMYDYRTRYSNLFGGFGGYIFNKEHVLNEIKDFITENNLTLQEYL